MKKLLARQVIRNSLKSTEYRKIITGGLYHCVFRS